MMQLAVNPLQPQLLDVRQRAHPASPRHGALVRSGQAGARAQIPDVSVYTRKKIESPAQGLRIFAIDPRSETNNEAM